MNSMYKLGYETAIEDMVKNAGAGKALGTLAGKAVNAVRTGKGAVQEAGKSVATMAGAGAKEVANAAQVGRFEAEQALLAAKRKAIATTDAVKAAPGGFMRDARSAFGDTTKATKPAPRAAVAAEHPPVQRGSVPTNDRPVVPRPEPTVTMSSPESPYAPQGFASLKQSPADLGFKAAPAEQAAAAAKAAPAAEQAAAAAPGKRPFYKNPYIMGGAGLGALGAGGLAYAGLRDQQPQRPMPRQMYN